MCSTLEAGICVRFYAKPWVCRGMEPCRCGWELVCWTFLSMLSHSRRERRSSRALFTRQWAVCVLQTQHVAFSPEIHFWLWFDKGVFGYSPGLTFWKPLLWPLDVMSCVFRQTLWCIGCSWSFWVTSVHLDNELNRLLWSTVDIVNKILKRNCLAINKQTKNSLKEFVCL